MIFAERVESSVCFGPEQPVGISVSIISFLVYIPLQIVFLPLAVFGVLIVAGVYLYSRNQRSKSDEPEPPRISPELGEPGPEAGDADEASEEVGEGRPAGTNGGATDQKIVTLRLVARNNGSINGEELALNLRGIGMRHGKFGIYHRLEAEDDDRIVFSAASLVEPGTFDLKNLKEQQIPGIS